MKGHATIELTNVKTGEVQTIEEDNIITNYLPKLLTPHYPFKATFVDSFDEGVIWCDPNNNNPPITPFHDFGGVIIFKEQLEEDPENYRPTATMVGHADNRPYSGVDLTRGSFNANMSKWHVSYGGTDTEQSGAKLVWDFGLEQANGTIGTVCLCNHNDGCIGYGSEYQVASNLDEMAWLMHHRPVDTNSMFSFYCQEDFDIETEGGLYTTPRLRPIYYDNPGGRLVFIDDMMLYNNGIRFVVVDTNSNSIQPINSRYIRNSSINNAGYTSLYNYTAFNSFRSMESHYEYIDTVDGRVEYSSYNNDNYQNRQWTYMGVPLYAYNFLSGVDSEGNFWYSKNGIRICAWNNGYQNNKMNTTYVKKYGDSLEWKWNSGTTRVFVKVDLKTMESTEYTVTNTTGVDLKVCHAMNRDKLISSITHYNGRLIFRNTDGYMYGINLENNSDVIRYKLLNSDTDLKVSRFPVLADLPDNYSYYIYDKLSDLSYGINSMFTYINKNQMYFNTGNNLEATNYNTSQMLMLDMNTGIVKYCNCPGRSWYPAFECEVKGVGSSSYGSSSQTSSGSNLESFCVTSDDIEFIPIILPFADIRNYPSSNNKVTWTDTAKNIRHYYPMTMLFKPMGLITINALDKPVVKTSDMTMRITYTITA